MPTPARPLRAKLLDAAKWLLFTALGIGIIYYSLQSIPPDKYAEFTNAIKQARYELALPVLLILSASHWLRAWRWQLLIEPLGKKPSLVNAFFAVMIGYLANLAVPRLGEVLRCTLLSKYEKIKTEELVGTVVAERAFDMICLGIVFLLALIFQFDIIWNFLQESLSKRSDAAQPSSPWLWYFLGGTIVFGLALFLFRKTLLKSAIVLRIWAAFGGLKRGLISARELKHRGAFFLSSALIWVLYIGGTYIGFMATTGTQFLAPDVALTALAMGTIGMILTPGGIGSYAFFLAEAMRQNGVPFEIGYANGTLQWLAQFVVVLLVGSLSLLLLPIYNRYKQAKSA